MVGNSIQRFLLVVLVVAIAPLNYSCNSTKNPDNPTSCTNAKQMASKSLPSVKPFSSKASRFINSLGMTLLRIPSGTFWMGNKEAINTPDEAPYHKVAFKHRFFMSAFETTRGQYADLCGKSEHVHKGSSLPVVNVSWFDALNFCKSLTTYEQKNLTIPTSWFYTLPSESQWEYACRAGTTAVFYFGDFLNKKQANYDGFFPVYGVPKDLSESRLFPVGSFQANSFGLYDMHGNVSEWCLDLTSANYRDAPSGGRARMSAESYFVCRGGSAYSGANTCRSSNRCLLNTPKAKKATGFRVVLIPVKVGMVDYRADVISIMNKARDIRDRPRVKQHTSDFEF